MLWQLGYTVANIEGVRGVRHTSLTIQNVDFVAKSSFFL